VKLPIVASILTTAAMLLSATTTFAQAVPGAVAQPATAAALLPAPAGGTQSIVVNDGGALSVIVLPATVPEAVSLDQGTGAGAAASTPVRFQRPAPAGVAVMESDQWAGSSVSQVSSAPAVTGTLQQVRPEFMP
jgi:hypothetical protein